MTALSEGCFGPARLQLFTERYGEFIFGNDRVTALSPIWRSHQGLYNADPYSAGLWKALLWTHAGVHRP